MCESAVHTFITTVWHQDYVRISLSKFSLCVNITFKEYAFQEVIGEGKTNKINVFHTENIMLCTPTKTINEQNSY